MLNHIVFHGPELHTTQSGISVTLFTLAIDRDLKDKYGNDPRSTTVVGATSVSAADYRYNGEVW